MQTRVSCWPLLDAFFNGKCFIMKVAGDTPSPWCHNEPPLAYSYIQKVILICLSLFSFTLHWSQVHWDNGFLAYWDTKQLPNFLLAVPCVLMVLHHSWEFVQVGKVTLRFLQLIANM